MKAILDSEGVTQGRRDRLGRAYNRGFRGYSLTYRVCTPAADEAARPSRFIAEGERLSHAHRWSIRRLKTRSHGMGATLLGPLRKSFRKSRLRINLFAIPCFPAR